MLTKYSNVIYKDGDQRKDPRYSNNILIFRRVRASSCFPRLKRCTKPARKPMREH